MPWSYASRARGWRPVSRGGGRGTEVGHSTINRWVLACAPLIEKRLRQFHRSHCGSVRIDETYVKFRSKWRYLYRAIDKYGSPVNDWLEQRCKELWAQTPHGKLELLDARIVGAS